jgi:hypothetical protein
MKDNTADTPLQQWSFCNIVFHHSQLQGHGCCELRCIAQRGNIFGLLQIGGGRHPFISLVLIGDAQLMHKSQRCADAQLRELCICASQKSVHRFLGFLVLL